MISFEDAFAELPLIAILRGLDPADAPDVGAVLVERGFRILEVPLNSPEPFESIKRLAGLFADRAVIGAGTVLNPDSVGEIEACGGRLIVMPHSDRRVIAVAKARGLVCCPGVATPSEAFAALEAGADALKLFPGESLPPAAVKALRAVLPAAVRLLPVGGITPETMAGYRAAGAAGFGIGSALFTPELGLDEIARRAERFAAAWSNMT